MKFKIRLFTALAAAFCLTGAMPAMANTCDETTSDLTATAPTINILDDKLGTNANDAANTSPDLLNESDTSVGKFTTTTYAQAGTADIMIFGENDSAGTNANTYAQASSNGNKTEKSPPSDGKSGNDDNTVKKLVPEVASRSDLHPASGRFAGDDCSATT